MTIDYLPEIVAHVRQALSRGNKRLPEIAIVCGSGLSELSSKISDPLSLPYSTIPHFPQSTVAGHGSELVFGLLGGKPVVAQRGRFHFYEGHHQASVVIAVRLFAALGCKIMIATNAAGGVNSEYSVGDIMVISDHISFPCLSGNHPLVGHNDDRFGPRFPAVNQIYHPSLQAIASSVAASRGLSKYLQSGTYFHDSGPTYESPMEIHAMRLLGGDAVGMSTVPEVLVAAHSGITVLGLSLITNQCLAPGDKRTPPSHEEVLESTKHRAEDMQGFVADIVQAVPSAFLESLPTPKAHSLFFGPTGGRTQSHSSRPFGLQFQGSLLELSTIALFASASVALIVESIRRGRS
jgi:purine-nucleoside phosphorylase